MRGVTQTDRQAAANCSPHNIRWASIVTGGGADNDPIVQAFAAHRQAAYAAGRADGAKAGAEIVRYTSHDLGCHIYQRSWANGDPGCSCGLDKIRAAIAAAGGE